MEQFEKLKNDLRVKFNLTNVKEISSKDALEILKSPKFIPNKGFLNSTFKIDIGEFNNELIALVYEDDKIFLYTKQETSVKNKFSKVRNGFKLFPSIEAELINLLASYEGKDLPDSVIHEFAKQNNLDVHELEAHIYKYAINYVKTLKSDIFKDSGKCPSSGCVKKKPNGKWGIISNKTGEFWKANYDNEDEAKAALKAYHVRKRSFSDEYTINLVNNLAKQNNIPLESFKIDQIIKGMKVELEHGTELGDMYNVTDNDGLKTLKIVLAHLTEDPIYYDKLELIESKTFSESFDELIDLVIKSISLPLENIEYIDKNLNLIESKLTSKDKKTFISNIRSELKGLPNTSLKILDIRNVLILKSNWLQDNNYIDSNNPIPSDNESIENIISLLKQKKVEDAHYLLVKEMETDGFIKDRENELLHSIIFELYNMMELEAINWKAVDLIIEKLQSLKTK